VRAYKLFKKRKNGTLGSLFIGARAVHALGEWMKSECIPTKGFKVRQGWHCTAKPIAPHLSKKSRVWCLVEIDKYTELKRPESQGGLWYLADNINIIKEL